MKRLLGLSFLVLLTPVLAADKEEFDNEKEALQALNDFIGSWKGSGGPEAKARPTAKETWSETVDFGWRFKGNDAWMTVTFKKGRFFKSGDLHYLTDKKVYQLTLTDLKDKKRVFTGNYENSYLTLEHVDEDSMDTFQLKMNLAAGGDRFIYRYARKPEGKTIFVDKVQLGATKEGVSLAAKEKKIECVVSGGLGTMAVSFMGKTYYVCCSGCRDAFNENPEKYVKEFEAKQKKK